MDTGTLQFGKIAGAVCGALTLILATRVLGPGDFGLYSLVFAISMTARQFFDSRSGDLLTRYLPLCKAEGNLQGVGALLALSFAMEAAAVALAGITMVSSSSFVADKILHDPAQKSLLWGGAAWLASNTGQSTFRSILIVEREFRRLAGIDAGASLSALALTMGAVVLTPSVQSLIWASVVATLLANLFALAQASRTAREKLGPPLALLSGIRFSALRAVRGGLGDILRFAGGTNLFATVRLVQAGAPSLLLSAVLSPTHAGYYLLAQRFAGYMNTLAAPVQTTVTPRFSAHIANRQTAKSQSLLVASSTLCLVVALPFLLILVILGRWSLPLLLGAGFRAAFPTVAIVVGAYALGLMATPSGVLLLMAGRMSLLNHAFTLGLLLQLSTLAFLVPPLASTGAAVAYAVFYMFVAPVQIVTASRYLAGALATGARERPPGTIRK